MKKYFGIGLLISTFVSLMPGAYAHKGQLHGPADHSSSQEQKSIKKEEFQEINGAYLQTVRPIFAKKCFDCHSGNTRYPWYYKIPGARQLIERDVKEAKRHLDLSDDFPFGGHGAPYDDLEAIRETIHEGSMPPLRYRMLHIGSGITEEEKKAVFEWIESSQKLIHQK